MHRPCVRRHCPTPRLAVIYCGLLSLLFLFPLPAAAQEKTCLQQVRELKLEFMPGRVPTYFSPGHQKRASEMKALLEEASIFYERALGLKPELTLAAVSPAEWASLLDKPYGLPTMRPGPCKTLGVGANATPQYVAIMPATVGGPIYDGWMALKDSLTPRTMKELKKSGVEFGQGGKMLLDFVALHELGHAYAHGYGINTLSGFFAEHIGNYFAYAFLRSTRGRLDKKVMAILAANVEAITPIHASLEKFETFRSREHPPTETWYNSVFTLKAAEVYAERGLAFLKDVREAFSGEKYGSITNEVILSRLEKIQPGYIKWSQEFPQLADKLRARAK